MLVIPTSFSDLLAKAHLQQTSLLFLLNHSAPLICYLKALISNINITYAKATPYDLLQIIIVKSTWRGPHNLSTMLGKVQRIIVFLHSKFFFHIIYYCYLDTGHASISSKSSPLLLLS